MDSKAKLNHSVLHTNSCPPKLQLTRWGSDCKPGMQTGQIVYHIKCDRCDHSEGGEKNRQGVHGIWESPRHRTVQDTDNQRDFYVVSCQRWLSQAARRSESLSSRKANLSGGQQVRAPSFYKLQLIGHPVFSTKCSTHHLPPAPWTRPLQLHSSYHMRCWDGLTSLGGHIVI